MKKFLLTTLSLLLCTSIAFAEEAQPVAEQTTEIDCSGFVGVINKQPQTTSMKQTVKITRSGFALIINVNGKVEIPTKEEATK